MINCYKIPVHMFLFLVLFFFASCNHVDNKNETNKLNNSRQNIENISSDIPEGLYLKADSALAFCREKGMNTDFCILVDMKRHSGTNRFFVWDMQADTLIMESLCAHGYGRESTQNKPVFSNVEGSYCTSLGKYKTGVRSYSQYGINVHYKLHGLEKSNSNAFRRIVVLHSHDPIPVYQIYPRHLPLGYSQGCPVINNAVMAQLDKMFKEQKKPTLLWIYY